MTNKQISPDILKWLEELKELKIRSEEMKNTEEYKAGWEDGVRHGALKMIDAIYDNLQKDNNNHD